MITTWIFVWLLCVSVSLTAVAFQLTRLAFSVHQWMAASRSLASPHAGETPALSTPLPGGGLAEEVPDYRRAPEKAFHGYVVVDRICDEMKIVTGPLELEEAVTIRSYREQEKNTYPSLHKKEGAWEVRRAKVIVGDRVELRAV